MPVLQRLIIADDPEAWTRAGFAVDDAQTVLGTVAVSFVEPDDGATRGVVGWHLVADDDTTTPSSEDPVSIDGISTSMVDPAPVDPAPSPHDNGVSRLDHVVINTDDLSRTIPALETAGFEVRRHRDVPGSTPTRRQVFLWAGEPILEVVGLAESMAAPGSGTGGPARIWGLALTTDDLDGAVERLGPMVTTPKAAVQQGRRIATIDTRGLGIGIALALMTPH